MLRTRYKRLDRESIIKLYYASARKISNKLVVKRKAVVV